VEKEKKIKCIHTHTHTHKKKEISFERCEGKLTPLQADKADQVRIQLNKYFLKSLAQRALHYLVFLDKLFEHNFKSAFLIQFIVILKTINDCICNQITLFVFYSNWFSYNWLDN